MFCTAPRIGVILIAPNPIAPNPIAPTPAPLPYWM